MFTHSQYKKITLSFHVETNQVRVPYIFDAIALPRAYCRKMTAFKTSPTAIYWLEKMSLNNSPEVFTHTQPNPLAWENNPLKKTIGRNIVNFRSDNILRSKE